jgi:CheY-like chemotaxis protein/two-component sensor histidine kinase
MSAMLGWLHLLKVGKLSAEQQANALDTIERNARMQASLVEDILDVSRIITGKLMLKVGQVDLASVVAAALDTVRMAAEAKQIEVALELDDKLALAAGDPERLQQVVWNLLANAIKFTQPGGRVHVRMQRDGEEVELSVQDDGQGIAVEFLPFVFDRFRQADSTSTRVHGGLGLGLAIVRHLVELHGGTVRADSEGQGRGATFTVRLPCRPADSAGSERGLARAEGADEIAAPAASLGVSGQLSGMTVLVVDDEADTRELLIAVLEHHGASVMAAGCVSEALAALDQRAPHVIVSDIGMPEADGYELMRRLRALEDERRRNTPAVALTGFARPEDGARASEAGFDAHMAKPVDPVALIRVIERVAVERRTPPLDGVAQAG